MPLPPSFSDTATSSTTTWDDWNSVTSNSALTVWVSWNSGTNTTTGNSASSLAYPVRQFTAEEAQRQDERRERLRREQAERDRLRAEAEARAENLLREHLTPEQQLMLDQMNQFIVRGSQGGQYAIRRGRVGNVTVLDPDDRPLHRLCAHPREALPDPDTMLAQKLLLETDEEAFVRIANIPPV